MGPARWRPFGWGLRPVRLPRMNYRCSCASAQAAMSAGRPLWADNRKVMHPPAPGASPPVLAVGQHTVFALSTPRAGGSAIAIIRISGRRSAPVLSALLGQGQKLPRPRTAAVRSLVHPHSGDVLDKAVVVWLPGPSSYTGEDMVELHVHGGTAIIADVMAAIGADPHVREAQAGEFTRLAFANGRLDLSEAEGVADLIRAQTSRQRRQAMRLAGGELRQTCDGWRDELMGCLARTQTLIDFAEDEPVDEDGTLWKSVLEGLDRTTHNMRMHLRGDRAAEMVRDGVRVTVVGPPNAGKSSLFNRLLKRDAAIVSPYPGTTRDLVDASVRVGDVLLNVADTAGVRHTPDPVEAEGVRRALDSSSKADINIVVVQATEDDLISTGMNLDATSTLVVLNKIDLIRSVDVEELEQGRNRKVRGMGPDGDIGVEVAVHFTSCITSAGLVGLVASLEQTVEKVLEAEIISEMRAPPNSETFEDLFNVGSGEGANEAGSLLLERHRLALGRCVERLEACAYHETQPELAAEELREALSSLSEISGTVHNEKILDLIFSQFCIGK